MINLKPACTILDLGIGTGLMHSLILEECNYNLTGLDFSQRICDYAYNRLHSDRIVN
jgi:ubiquinone/menaquinone biosynthesis C-methylase UbiE